MYSSIKCVNSLKRIVDPDGTGARSHVSTEPPQRQFEALENRQQNIEEVNQPLETANRDFGISNHGIRDPNR